MSKSPLLLNQVSRTYSQGENALEVLKAVHLEVKAGEVVALVGPSGSGKTTLLQIAGLLDRPDRGEITIGGESANVASDQGRTLLRRRHIGFIYQFHHLLREF